MHCTSCNRFLGDKVKICDYCGAKQRRRPAATPPRDVLPAAPPYAPYEQPRMPPLLPPQASPVKNARLAAGIICLFLVMTVLPLLIVFVSERADDRANQQFTLPRAQEPTTRDSWEFNWGLEDPPGFTITTSRQLLDNPENFFFRRVSVHATVSGYTRHEADAQVYGTFYSHAVYVLYAEDETGPLLLVIEEDRANLDNDDDDWQSGTLRFSGHFWDLRDVNGERMPMIEVVDWERN